MEDRSLSTLWADELEDLWSAEQAMLDALPEAGMQDDEVKELFRQRQARTEGQLERLREIFIAETLAQRSRRRGVPRQRRPNRRAKRSSRDALSAGA